MCVWGGVNPPVSPLEETLFWGKKCLQNVQLCPYGFPYRSSALNKGIVWSMQGGDFLLCLGGRLTEERKQLFTPPRIAAYGYMHIQQGPYSRGCGVGGLTRNCGSFRRVLVWNSKAKAKVMETCQELGLSRLSSETSWPSLLTPLFFGVVTMTWHTSLALIDGE